MCYSLGFFFRNYSLQTEEMTDEDMAQIERNKALPNKNRKDADVPGKSWSTVQVYS